jgi:hypothetical protein
MSVARIPDDGVKVLIIGTCRLAEVGVELLRPELGRGDREAHILLARGSTCAGPARADLDALGQHPEVGLGLGGLLDVRHDVDLGLDRDGAKVACVTSIGLLGDVSDCGHDILLCVSPEACSSGDAGPSMTAATVLNPKGRSAAKDPRAELFWSAAFARKPLERREKSLARGFWGRRGGHRSTRQAGGTGRRASSKERSHESTEMVAPMLMEATRAAFTLPRPKTKSILY